MIQGIMHEGDCITNPHQIKLAFLNFYKENFKAQETHASFTSLNGIATLLVADHSMLEDSITMEEIRIVVWDCGSEKAHGPEGLHLALQEAVQSGFIHRSQIGSSEVWVSYLFYADDVVITSNWCMLDMENIIRVLQLFFLASGLKINIHKSNVYGVGVSSDEVNGTENVTSCEALIKSVHGEDVDFNQNGCKIKGIQAMIVGTINNLHSSNVIPHGTLWFKVGCGLMIRFWKDVWIWDSSLETRYNSVFRLVDNKDCLVRDRISNVSEHGIGVDRFLFVIT
ncbi:hypothetical protein Tco_0934067 [Tanacetum coccineum]